MYSARDRLRRFRRWAVEEMPYELRRWYKRLKGIREHAGKPAPKRPRKPSAPGEPPRVRPGSPLKRLLFYSFDPTTKTVVIGPARFGTSQPPAPWVLEFGGMTMLGKKLIKVLPRPFMRPSLEEERPRLPRRWAASVRG